VCAGISPAGDRIVTVGKNGVICSWEFDKPMSDAASLPTADLRALAQVHAGGYVDEQGVFRPMSAAELRAAWAKLHPSR
jgi:hypothetical protein